MLNLEGAIKAENLRNALHDHARATLLGEALGYVASKKARALTHEARSGLEAAEQDLAQLESRLANIEAEIDREELEKQVQAKRKRISELQDLIGQLQDISRVDTPMLREMMLGIYPFDKVYSEAKLKDRFRR